MKHVRGAKSWETDWRAEEKKWQGPEEPPFLARQRNVEVFFGGRVEGGKKSRSWSERRLRQFHATSKKKFCQKCFIAVKFQKSCTAWCFFWGGRLSKASFANVPIGRKEGLDNNRRKWVVSFAYGKLQKFECSSSSKRK